MKKTFLTIILLLLTLPILYNTEEEYKLNVYFCPEDNCEDIFVNNLLKNKESKCAFYDLSNERVINALNNTNSQFITHQGNRRGLMHHKFCVLNQTHVITGSANPTDNDLKNNPNNILLIKSKTQSQRYKAEFYRLNQKNYDYPPNKILKSYFCPYHNCQNKILHELNKAKENIWVLTFTFTDHEIAKELIRKNQKGIDVKVITDNFQNKQYWTKPFLKNNNVSIKVNKENIQHNKVFIIDGETVITGSYNPTKAAYTINNENILIIKNKEIGSLYRDYFKYISNNKI